MKKLKTFCTMNYAAGIMNLQRKVVTGRPKPPRLEELAAHYGVGDAETARMADGLFGGGDSLHDARYDAVMTYLCLMAALGRGDLRNLG